MAGKRSATGRGTAAPAPGHATQVDRLCVSRIRHGETRCLPAIAARRPSLTKARFAKEQAGDCHLGTLAKTRQSQKTPSTAVTVRGDRLDLLAQGTFAGKLPLSWK